MAVGLALPREESGQRSTAFAVLAGISVSHLLNDAIQAIVPAIYPMLKAAFALNFAQVGLMTLTHQVTASLLQPLVGLYTDRRRRHIHWWSAWLTLPACCCWRARRLTRSSSSRRP
jgi:hypothetical protein